MDYSNSSLYDIENNLKIYPLPKRHPSSNSTARWPSDWYRISPRSVSSPSAFLSNTLGLEQTSVSLQNNSKILGQSRVVSFPEYIYAPQRIQSAINESDTYAGERTFSDGNASFSLSNDSIEITLNSESCTTTAFPNIAAFTNTTLRNDEKETQLQRDEDWLTWTTSPPRPIPALHGPASLPYARCPSGAEGTVIEEPSLLPHVIWGLEPNDMLGFQYSQNVRKKHSRFSKRKDSIYAIHDQRVTKMEAKENLIPNDFIYPTSPPSFESPIIYNLSSQTILGGSPNDSVISRDILHPIEHAAQKYAYPPPEASGLGLRTWNPTFVEPPCLNEQAPPTNFNYLPTPPNSSSPQWSAMFSPPTYHSFLIPISEYDTSDPQAMGDYPETFNTTSNPQHSSTTEILDSLPASKTYESSVKGNSNKRPSLSSFRENLTTVAEESPQPLPSAVCISDDLPDAITPTIPDDVDHDLQSQSAQEYFASEEKKDPIVSLPARVQPHRNPNAFTTDGRTVHPKKLGIQLKKW